MKKKIDLKKELFDILEKKEKITGKNELIKYNINLEAFFPNKKIFYLDTPVFTINQDGNTDNFHYNDKLSVKNVATYRFNSVDKLITEINKNYIDKIYIYSIYSSIDEIENLYYFIRFYSEKNIEIKEEKYEENIKNKEEEIDFKSEFLKILENELTEIKGKKKLIHYDNILQRMLPNKTLYYLDLPCISINRKGDLIQNDMEVGIFKNIGRYYFDSLEDFSKKNNKSNIDKIYIYSINLIDRNLDKKEIIVTYYRNDINDKNKEKKKLTFTISEDIYADFSILSDKMAINKSKFVENMFIEFIKKNK